MTMYNPTPYMPAQFQRVVGYPQDYMMNPQNYQQNYNQQPVVNTGLKGRVVTSIDEAKSAMIDLDGSLFIFPDIANKRIYTKQINLDGTASLLVYNLQENTQPQIENEPKTIFSKEDMESIINNKMEELKREIEEIKGGILNVKQSFTNSTNVSTAKK